MDMGADRGLGQIQFFSGLRKDFHLCHTDKGLQLFQIHKYFPLSKAACYSAAISLTARTASSISASVLKWDMEKRTAPVLSVPRARCISGAQ